MDIKIQDQPLSLAPALSSDFGAIRYMYADLGDGKPIVRVATIERPESVSQEDLLALAAKMAAAPWLFQALKNCIGYVSAAAEQLNDAGKTDASKKAHKIHDDAIKALSFATKNSYSILERKMKELGSQQ